TPAVSLAVVSHLLTTSSQPLDVVIVGVGAQGRAHARTVESVCEGIRDTKITFISRTQPADLDNWLQAGSDPAHEAICNAELIISTTHTTPDEVIEDEEGRNDDVVVAVS